MEAISLLERQKAMLQRIYQTDFSWNNQQFDHHCLSSEAILPTPNQSDWQCNSSFKDNPKKRKAEIDAEDNDNGGKAEEEKSEITTKTERETSANTCSKVGDYIHVRARRGQATDSHSLAERARREKISKKMKCLQDLVPGCDKVSGKAGMLDEIITYVQSLQKQVEFLSMKLATVNPRLDFSISTKEILGASFEASSSTCFHYNPTQQGNSSLPISQLFIDSSSPTILPSHFQDQQLSGWESDCQGLFTAGFH